MGKISFKGCTWRFGFVSKIGVKTVKLSYLLYISTSVWVLPLQTLVKISFFHVFLTFCKLSMYRDKIYQGPMVILFICSVIWFSIYLILWIRSIGPARCYLYHSLCYLLELGTPRSSTNTLTLVRAYLRVDAQIPCFHTEKQTKIIFWRKNQKM